MGVKISGARRPPNARVSRVCQDRLGYDQFYRGTFLSRMIYERRVPLCTIFTAQLLCIALPISISSGNALLTWNISVPVNALPQAHHEATTLIPRPDSAAFGPSFRPSPSVRHNITVSSVSKYTNKNPDGFGNHSHKGVSVSTARPFSATFALNSTRDRALTESSANRTLWRRGNWSANKTKMVRYGYNPGPRPDDTQNPVVTPYFSYIREDAPVGSHVVTIRAAQPNDGNLLYRIVGGNELGHFQIEPSTGYITIAAPLDRELVDGYNLSVGTYDNAGHACFAPVYIRITDINDNAPVIRDRGISFTVPCGIADHFIGMIFAMDLDTGRNGELHFSLEENYDNMGLFMIDSLTGALSTRTELRPGFYSVTVAVQDSGYNQLRTTTNVDVHVTCPEGPSIYETSIMPSPEIPDRNPQLPPCPGEPVPLGPVYLNANSMPGTFVAGVASLSLTGLPVSYSLFPDQSTIMFEIDHVSGVMRTRERIPNSAIEYPVTWIATDVLNTACMGEVLVRIVPGDNEPPYGGPPPDRPPVGYSGMPPPEPLLHPVLRFAQSEYLFTIRCGESNMPVGRITLESNDLQAVPRFDLINAPNTFRIEREVGELVITDPLPAFPSTYSFLVEVMAGPDMMKTVPVHVEVECQTGTPAFSPTFPSAIPPQCPTQPVPIGNIGTGTAVGTAVATVKAMAPNSHGISYVLNADGPSSSVVSGWFEIDLTTGSLTVSRRLTDALPVNQPVTLSVRASDVVTGLSCLITIQLQLVNGNPPIFPAASYELDVGCLQAGDLVGYVRAVNQDAASILQHTYFLSGLDASMFTIGQNGEIRAAGNLNQPTRTYSAVVNVQDSNKLFAQTSVTIRQLCTTPATPLSLLPLLQCLRNSVVFRVNDSTPTNSQLGLLSELVRGSELSYTIIQPTNSDAFGVNFRSGVLFLRQPVNSLPLLTTSRTTNLVIRVTDATRNFCDVTATLTLPIIQSLPPIFPNSTYRFSTGCLTLGQLIGVVQARSSSSNRVLTYDLTGPDAASFSVSERTGEIRSKLSVVSPIQQSFLLTAGAADSVGMKAQVPLFITVNCDPPVCPPAFTILIPETATVGTVVGQVSQNSILDNDEPSQNRLTYRIATPTPIPVAVNPASGMITLTGNPIQPAISAPVNLVVTAANALGFVCNISASVVIARRQRVPEFVGMPYVFSPTCIQTSDVVGRVTVSARHATRGKAVVSHHVSVDSGSSGSSGIMYSMANGDTRQFNVDVVSGEIRFIGYAANGTTVRTYEFQVAARTTAGLTNFVSVRVDLPFCPIQCPANVVEQLQPETPQGTAVARLGSQIVPQRGDAYFFRVLSAVPTDAFQTLSLDPLSGVLTVNGTLRALAGRSVELQIAVTVRQPLFVSPFQSCIISLRLDIPPPRPPSFACPSSTVATVRQDAEVGTLVTRVTAGERGDFVYTLLESGSALGYFQVDRTGGAVTVARQLVDLSTRTYPLSVRVTSAKDATQFCETVIEVTLQSNNQAVRCVDGSSPVTVNLEPAAKPGDVIALVSAFSPLGLPVTFSVTETPSRLVGVNRTSGALTLRDGIFSVPPQSYRVSVRASDSTGAFCDTTILLHVPNINQPPAFSSPAYQFIVDCGLPGTLVGVVAARDLDGGAVAFTVAPSDLFIIDSSGGIRARTAVRAPLSAQTLTVTAADNSGRASSVPVTVTFQGPSCAVPPRCSQSFYRFDLPLAAPGALVGAVFADGIQPTSQRLTVRYTLFGPDQNLFAIDSSSGNINQGQVTLSGNQTAFQIGVRASLTDYTSLFCEMTVQIQIPAVTIPKFAQSSFLFDIPCGTSTQCLGTLQMERSTTGANLLFSAQGDPSITVNRQSGEVCVQNPSDSQSRSATVTVTDFSRGFSAAAEVAINILPCRRPPVCVPDLVRTAVNEGDSVGTRVQQVSANGEGAMTYAIENGSINDSFSLNRQSGIISLSRVLDRETVSSFLLNVSATDSAGLTCHTVVDITVIDTNDNTPVFLHGPYVWSAECNRPFTYLGTVSAVDADVGINARITYSVAPGSLINVDGQTGEVRTEAGLNAGPVSDLTSGPRAYNFDVFAADAGSPQRTASALITVTVTCPTMLPPVCPPAQTIQIPENAPPNTVVARLTDLGNSVSPVSGQRYALLGLGAQNFVVSDDGRILVTGPLDRESDQNVYRLTVSTFGTGAADCQTNFTVIVTDVNDQPPVFASRNYQFVVTCGFTGVIGQVAAVDADQGQNAAITYSINGSNNLQIDPSSGQIRAVLPIPPFPSPQIVTVTATDGGVPSLSSTTLVTVSVQCIPTTAAPASSTALVLVPFTCPENVVSEVQENQSGLVISNILPYAGSVLNDFGLVYSLLPTVDAASFRLDGGNSGRLIVSSPLDREVQSTYFITVRISNRFGQNCDVPVRVNIVDTNDNTPAFPPDCCRFSLDCAGQLPYTAGVAAASDADAGVNALITYTLQNDPAFVVNLATGSISLSSLLPPGSQLARSAVITASNPGFPVRSTTTVVQISLAENCIERTISANLQVHTAPQCIGLRGITYNYVEISENAPVGTSLGIFEAVSAEAVPGLAYKVASGDPVQSFFLHPETGELRVNGVLDREAREYYNMSITVADFRGQVCSLPVYVRVMDSNDNAPTVTNMVPLVATVQCNVPNALIIQIQGADRDQGQNAQLTYSLDAQREFQISPTGEIRTVLGISSQPAARFIVITISDQGSPSLSTTVTLTVNVFCPNSPTSDVPRFDQQYYCAGIPEHSPANSEVTRVQARYALNRRDINYVLRSGNSALFSLDPLTGVIRTRQPLDVDRAALLGDNTLVVGTLQNKKTNPDAYAVVFVNVLDVNDEAPVFDQDYRLSVPARTLVNTAVGRLHAQDHDRTYPNNFIVDYQLVSGGLDSQYFRIDSTGELVISRSLQGLEGRTIPVSVLAVDGGLPPKTTTAVVQISVV